MNRFAAAAVLLCLATSAHAQYPAKPVRYIVPMSAGSGADTLARIFTIGLSQSFGQQVIVENRTGAAGNIGAEAAARVAALRNTMVSKRMSELGYIAVGNTPDEFAAHIRSEIDKLAKILAPLRGTIQ